MRTFAPHNQNATIASARRREISPGPKQIVVVESHAHAGARNVTTESNRRTHMRTPARRKQQSNRKVANVTITSARRREEIRSLQLTHSYLEAAMHILKARATSKQQPKSPTSPVQSENVEYIVASVASASIRNTPDDFADAAAITNCSNTNATPMHDRFCLPDWVGAPWFQTAGKGRSPCKATHHNKFSNCNSPQRRLPWPRLN